MKIISVGDMSFYGKNLAHVDPSIIDAFQDEFQHAAIVIANLESPLIDPSYESVSGKCTLNGLIGWAEVIKNCGITHINLANNHLMDYGEKGLMSTIEALNSVGLEYVGAGLDYESAHNPLITECDGKTLAFLGRSCVEVSSPCYAGVDRPGVAFGDEDELLEIVKECNNAVDYVILGLHWGIEHYSYPTPSQRCMAKKLMYAGANIILGHHPHVVQGEEKIGLGIVSYSSGNFLFDDFSWRYIDSDGKMHEQNILLSENHRKGLLLQVEIKDDGELVSRQAFSKIQGNAHVHGDFSLERQREYDKLCNRLHLPFYNLFWKFYSVIREWDLRLKQQYSPLAILKKIHKLRLRHFRELADKIKRSSRISTGKSTNPYE